MVSDIRLDDKRDNAKCALESLVSQCYKEIRNLERFEAHDERMLIATADLQFSFDRAMSAAQDLQEAFDAVANYDGDDD